MPDRVSGLSAAGKYGGVALTVFLVSAAPGITQSVPQAVPAQDDATYLLSLDMMLKDMDIGALASETYLPIAVQGQQLSGISSPNTVSCSHLTLGQERGSAVSVENAGLIKGGANLAECGLSRFQGTVRVNTPPPSS